MPELTLYRLIAPTATLRSDLSTRGTDRGSMIPLVGAAGTATDRGLCSVRPEAILRIQRGK